MARAVARAMPALLPDARDLLLAFSLIAADDEIVAGATNEPDRQYGFGRADQAAEWLVPRA